MDSPLLVAGFNRPKKKAAKAAPNKGTGEKAVMASPHTQVGEMAAAWKEPSHAQKVKRMAMDEKLHATRKWISGEISDAEHSRTHRRANEAMKKRP